jgi:hypothetical protein
MKFKNELKWKNCEWAESGPRPKAYWAWRPTGAAGHHGLMARLARHSSHSARPTRARCGTRAPPVVTTRWPRAWRWAGAAGGIQPGDKVWGNRRGQLTQEKGKLPGKAGLAQMHRGIGKTMGWWGRLGTVVFWWRGGSSDLQGPQQLHWGEQRGEGVAPIGLGWCGFTAHR